ncbi:ABC transporter ATP-binding protein [Serpentinicella alkaliphila]|uniref:Branched-chain amino acid transport system ATP-binding protein n=1 Tax=Serpentinicella alkaliphila TaxID=1734049 RepID=A0A4R2TZU7_9FIRM|nr:ABC transporter ATP-binding protein [Serpentinicella alkaliphila]QUH26447.1 ABC transporter ATP-binding protein [Serpentinicella alkaliphila]TCQ03279.1 branched-chain amino acid transport system ATP-binding protein [Serpentinicella alkaliphila]
MLKVIDLSVQYGYINALNSISFNVNKGEIITLIGGNGAGKTTTLMAISNVVQKYSGNVYFKEMNITDFQSHEIVHLGISHVPEGRKIFPALTVKENLIAGTFGNKRIRKNELNNKLEEVYTLFPRLRERINQGGGTLSGGEQQMLAIARGLMMDPDLIMLDEPSLGLAPIIIEEIFELILRIKKSGKTVLLIEQNAAMALQIADRGYVLERGKVLIEGTGTELIKDERVRKAYLGI